LNAPIVDTEAYYIKNDRYEAIVVNSFVIRILFRNKLKG